MNLPGMVKGLRRKVRRHISRKPSKRRKSKQVIHQTLDDLKYERVMINERLLKAEDELQNVKKDISLNIERQEEYETTIVALKNEGKEAHEKMEEELQNAKKELFLIKNHLNQCSQKQDYETEV